MMKTVLASPHASQLIESMRDIGYTLETALADIVDNSITAGASTIRLFADTEGLRIGVLDDGEGMSYAELLEAMRPGSRSPLDHRKDADLGRFGLGLKTASFSQCRKVSVVTRRAGDISAAQWDLDLVASTDSWLISLPENPLKIPFAEFLGSSGTLVVWENLDRLVSSDPVAESRDFVRRIDEARAHLELVFHRYLAGEKGLRKIQILLNGRPLEPVDPFNSAHPATIRGPVEIIRFNGHEVMVQTFTLPHHKKVSPGDWERFAGPAGYLKNQGFYVYREKRLIIHGTWFGLARQMELTKLARVRIDISNQQDAEWKVDVKKASVQPPFPVKERLRRIIETIGATSKRVYTSRGRRLVTDVRLPVWNRLQVKDEILYRVNSDHPVIGEFAGRLPEVMKEDFYKVLELAGASLPMDALFADMGGQPEAVAAAPASEPMLRHAVVVTWRQLAVAGVPLEDVKLMMQSAEPFRSNWSRAEAILNEIADRSDIGEC